MIKLNRTTEYGLIALRHIHRKHSANPKEVTSAREVADFYGLPFEITAKTLQRLKETGLIQSAHGARGGYTLVRTLDSVSLAEFLQMMEGPQAIVACAQSSKEGQALQSIDDTSCEYGGRCEIKSLMGHLNQRIFEFLKSICLLELVNELAFEASVKEGKRVYEVSHLS